MNKAKKQYGQYVIDADFGVAKILLLFPLRNHGWYQPCIQMKSHNNSGYHSLTSIS